MSDLDYMIDPDEREAVLTDASIASPFGIPFQDIVLRPITATSRAMLRATGNGFVTGEFHSNPELAILSFAWIHSQPLTEVIAAVYGTREGFLEKVMLWGSDIPFTDTEKLGELISEQFSAINLAKTRIDKPNTAGDPDPKDTGQPN